MAAEDKMIAKSQQNAADSNEEQESRYWLYFQKALDLFNSLREYKFVITPKVKCNFVWYKYSNTPPNGLASTSNKTRYLIPCDIDDLTDICEKLELAVQDFKLFQFMLPVIAPGCYDNRSKIAKGLSTYLGLQPTEKHSAETLHSISISEDNPKEVVSFIPELSQFPKQLLDLNLTRADFLQWLFGKAEVDMLSLHIGRAGCLPQGAKYAGQEECIAHSYRNVLILKSQPHLGKELPNSEPVLTPDGWVSNGSLKVGDYVIGSSGKPIKVLGVYPQGVKQVYKITFSDKTEVRCGLEHLWTVERSNGPRYVKETLTTAQLITQIKTHPDRNFNIPRFMGLSVGQNLEHAWQLGYAAGNGYYGDQLFISCHVRDLAIIKAKFDAISVIPGTTIQTSESSWQIAYGYKHLPPCFKELQAQSKNKVVPQFVKESSLESRQEYFMGYYDADGSHKTFSCSNIALFDGLVDLGRSVGHLITTAYNSRENKAQVLFLDPKYSVIKCPTVATERQHLVPYINKIERLNYQEESTCITVDSEDRLYVTSGYKLTHNSWFNNWLITGFEGCGLFTSVIQDLSRQFGHGTWVSSAWSYLDDSTEPMIAAFFNSPVLKTVASNGLVNVESKGVDHATVKAFTAPILMANDIDSRHLANCDSGNANRIKIVACKDIHSAKVAADNLPKSSPLHGIPSLIPAQIVNHICKKTGVTPELLSMYFIRLCVDYFNSFTLETMTEEIAKISQDLYASYMTNGINVLAKSAVLSHLLRHNLTVSDIKLLKVRFSEAGNSAPFVLESLMCLADLDSRVTVESQGLIKNLIKQHWLRTGKDVGHPWQTHRNYSTYFLTKLGTIAEAQLEHLSRKGRDSVPLEKVYQAVFSELRDIDGNPSVYSISRIQEAWKSALVLNFDYIKDIYLFIINQLKERNNLAELSLYRQRQVDYQQLFTLIATNGKSPLVEIPDDFFDGLKARDLGDEILWDGSNF